MAATTRPRPIRLLRVNRKGRPIHANNGSVPAVEAWVQAHGPTLRPGAMIVLHVWHDPDCRYPAGRPCTCRHGPVVQADGEDPITNRPHQ
jgi:hypothetical protein